jgi:thioredoxin-related protein
MKIARRTLLNTLTLLPLVTLFSCANSTSPSVITTDDLSHLSAEAKAKNLPIMLFVTAPYCGYCHQLERDVIVPMLKNARYNHYVLVRRFDLGKDTIIDFDGNAAESAQIAARYQAQLTPTLIFLSPDGKPLADNIKGVAADLDLYGGMIDGRINQALEKLGNTQRIRYD